jgi:hypothetical protein
MTRSIRDLVEKYKALEPSDRKIKRAVKQTLKAICGVDIIDTHIHIQQKTVFLTMHPIEKKSVFQKKSTLLLEINTILGGTVVTALK